MRLENPLLQRIQAMAARGHVAQSDAVPAMETPTAADTFAPSGPHAIALPSSPGPLTGQAPLQVRLREVRKAPTFATQFGPEGKTISGDVPVTDSATLRALRGVNAVDGDVVISGAITTAELATALADLQRVTGRLAFEDLPAVEALHLDHIRDLGGLFVGDCPSVRAIVIGADHIPGSVIVHDLPALETFALQTTTLGRDLELSGCAALQRFSATALVAARDITLPEHVGLEVLLGQPETPVALRKYSGPG